MAKKAANAAWQKKAENIMLLDMRDLFSIFDYFLILSAKSSRQLDSLVQAIKDELIEEKVKPIGIEGDGEAGWVLMDYGSVVIHIFTEGLRDYYCIERLFKDAPSLEVEGIG
ncbi:MAG: ribosome silencing factor [Actinomycetota bacterium]|nr:ribosome silencing factor [Actinomycetota bacterium]